MTYLGELPEDKTNCLRAGVPNLQDLIPNDLSAADVIIIEIKCTKMCLNHPETISPTLVHGNIVFHEAGPWCQRV